MTLDGVREGDLSAGYLTLYIDKSWMEANAVHKWSVTLDRYDEERGQWVSTQTKRVREDGDRIYYTVVVPGFSLLALTGGPVPASSPFLVTDLAISPQPAAAGQEVTFSARVVNTAASPGVYPASLWLDDGVAAVQDVPVGGGQSVSFSFTLRVEEGQHAVRVDRLLSSLTVGPPAAAPAPAPEAVATPTPAPAATPIATPTAAPETAAEALTEGGLPLALVAIGLVAVLAAAGGIAVIVVRRRMSAA